MTPEPNAPKFWSTPSATDRDYPVDTPQAAAAHARLNSRADSDQELGEVLKRCSGATLAAAREFRKTGQLIYLPTIIVGIVERFVENDLRIKLQSPRADLRLVEDLNIDSLTMMEIVMLAEEVLPIAINNEDLRFLRTLGDVQEFAEAKVRGLASPSVLTHFAKL